LKFIGIDIVFVIIALCFIFNFWRNNQKSESPDTMTSVATKPIVSRFSVVYVTVPSLDVGKQIARYVVQKKLAACVNIVPQLTSVYEWEGKLEEDIESMLIIKTKQNALESLKDAIKDLHPYEVPEFISLPIEFGSEPYLRWMEDQVNDQQREEEGSKASLNQKKDEEY